MFTPVISMKRFLVAGAVLALAACAHQPQHGAPPQASAADPSPFSGSIMRATAFREGDQLNFTLFSFSPSRRRSQTVQVSASCSGDEAWLVYMDTPRRLYPYSEDGLYNTAIPLKPDQLQALQHNPSFKQACAMVKVPEWRLVSVQPDGRRLYVDAANLHTQGSTRRVWLMEDYPDERPAAPYMAPMAQTRSYAVFDCARQTQTPIGGYALDASNRVTQSTSVTALQVRTVDEYPQDRPLYPAVCGTPADLAQLPGYAARIKPPAQVEYLDVVPGVAHAIQQLGLPEPRKTLHYVQIIGTSTTSNVTTAIDEEQFITADVDSGQWAITQRAARVRSSIESFRGLLNLTDHTHYQGATSWDKTSGVVSMAFAGDWQHMPIGAQLVYQFDSASLSSNRHYAGPVHVKTLCSVQSESAAARVNTQLSGKAKQLSCHWEGDAYRRTFTVQYLEDYGFFFINHMDPNRVWSYDRYLHVVR